MRDVSTPLDMTGSLLEDRRTLWIVAALVIFLFAIANSPWQLDDYDQAKQAFTSFEMIQEGHWFYQHTPREHVATKPPLVGWISAGLFSLTRSWDVAWRLPSLLAAIAISVLLFRAATSKARDGSTRLSPLRGEDEGEGSSVHRTIAGLIALSAFGLNLLSPRLATLVRTDMPLAFVIFLIGLLIWRKIQKEEVWKPRDRICILALLTVAMLIKGPIVYAFLLPGIALFQWRCRRHACRYSAWFGWWPWVASLGIFLLWAIGGILSQPGFFDEVVIREFIGRFGETIHRPQPLYFYLPHLLHKFAPWSVLMITLAIADLYSRKWQLRSVLREMSPETFWLLCWSVGGLVAMSLIPSKRVDRIFPIIPPLCLLLAAQIANRFAACSHGSVSRSSASFDVDPTGHRPVATENTVKRIYRWTAAALIFSVLFAGGYAISKVVFGYRGHRDTLVLFGRDVRREAAAHRWRYEVVSAKDEGLLLYLRRTHFIGPDRAIAQWNNGNLDALVAPAEKAPALMRELHHAALSQLRSNERKEGQGRSYVLITR